MDPYEFEQTVADAWEAQGYNTHVRQGSGDKGIDVVATANGRKELIQVKRYSTGNKVSGPDVRRYATLYQQEPTADKVVIVTTGSFTAQAKELGFDLNVSLISGDEIADIIENTNVLKSTSSRHSSHSSEGGFYASSDMEEPNPGKAGEFIIFFILMSTVFVVGYLVIGGVGWAIIQGLTFWTPLGDTIQNVYTLLSFVLYISGFYKIYPHIK